MERIGTLQGNDIILGKSPFSLREGEISAGYDTDGKLVLKCVLGGEITTLCREYFSFPYTMNTPRTIMGDLFGKTVIMGIPQDSLKCDEILMLFDDNQEIKLIEIIGGSPTVITPEALPPAIVKAVKFHTDGTNSISWSLDARTYGGNIHLESSIDGVHFNLWLGDTLTFGGDLDLYIRGLNDILYYNKPSDTGYLTFLFSSNESANRVDVSGKAIYLFDFNEIIPLYPNHGIRELFYNAEAIQSVSSDFLTGTMLGYSCFLSLFEGCINLTVAPELPFDELASYCYSSMFEGCTSLIDTPELPARILAEGCYNHMFDSCTSVNKVTSSATLNIYVDNIENMLYGTADTGTLYVTDEAFADWESIREATGMSSEWNITPSNN